MNAHPSLSRIATEYEPAEYVWRTETCGTCDNHGSTCYDCNGHGEWYSACADCHEERPLNKLGVCEECQAVNGWLDLTVQSLGGGVHRVAL